jgi:hypothetical protein
MIDTLGAYILVLILEGSRLSGITTQEFNSFEACQAAIVQLEPVQYIQGYCIAKEVKDEE